MTIWWFYLVVAVIVVGGIAFIWLTLKLNKLSNKSSQPEDILEDHTLAAEKDVEHIFNDDFREELRNRGRLHFEKIINDSAEFLQQDLRLTSSQLNEFMKSELSAKVREELNKYEQSINDARDLAIESLQRTTLAIEEQRKLLREQVQKEIENDKLIIVDNFEQQMTDIISHYVVDAIGKEVSLEDQLEFILADLETNKKAMIEDIKNV
jgi:hypothetical protein